MRLCTEILNEIGYFHWLVKMKELNHDYVRRYRWFDNILIQLESEIRTFNKRNLQSFQIHGRQHMSTYKFEFMNRLPKRYYFTSGEMIKNRIM